MLGPEESTWERAAQPAWQLAQGILLQKRMVTNPLWFLSPVIHLEPLGHQRRSILKNQIIPQVSWILEYGLPRFGS